MPMPSVSLSQDGVGVATGPILAAGGFHMSSHLRFPRQFTAPDPGRPVERQPSLLY